MALLVVLFVVIGCVGALLVIAGAIGSAMGARDAKRLPPNNRTVGGYEPAPVDPEERL